MVSSAALRSRVAAAAESIRLVRFRREHDRGRRRRCKPREGFPDGARVGRRGVVADGDGGRGGGRVLGPVVGVGCGGAAHEQLHHDEEPECGHGGDEPAGRGGFGERDLGGHLHPEPGEQHRTGKVSLRVVRRRRWSRWISNPATMTMPSITTASAQAIQPGCPWWTAQSWVWVNPAAAADRAEDHGDQDGQPAGQPRGVGCGHGWDLLR